MDRRRLLSMTVKLAGGFIAGAVSLPLFMHAFAPVFRTRPEEDWQPLGDLQRFPLNQVVSAKAGSKSPDAMPRGVFVWHKSDSEFVVYSRSCTDLGCPLNHDRGSGWYFCPCHGGVFDEEGRRRAGPPKIPMYRYASRIREGRLEIDTQSVPPMAR